MPATGSLSGLLAYPGSYDPGMPACSTIHTIDGEHSLTFYCENLPTDEAAEAAGRNPNGYFWEGVATFAFPDLAERLELDSEAGMFSAIGTIEDLQHLQEGLEPLLNDPEKLTALLARADAAGFEFED